VPEIGSKQQAPEEVFAYILPLPSIGVLSIPAVLPGKAADHCKFPSVSQQYNLPSTQPMYILLLKYKGEEYEIAGKALLHINFPSLALSAKMFFVPPAAI
jgi:hypothetical protein